VLVDEELGSGPSDPGLVGLLSLSPATEKRVAAARRFWPELDAATLEPLSEFELVDQSGTIFSIVSSDPLLGDPEQAHISAFAIADGRVYFLVATNETDASREAARLAADDDAARQGREHADWLADQPQHDVLLEGAPTLRESVLQIVNHGGRITADGLGGIRVTLPARLVDGGVLDGGMIEMETRRALQPHLENVARCQRVVLAALNSSSRKPLHERIPDGHPTITGGVG
jgi:hypothetical protein